MKNVDVEVIFREKAPTAAFLSNGVSSYLKIMVSFLLVDKPTSGIFVLFSKLGCV
ncbi:MAG: hypothetical protein Q8L78_04625 [Coxiellaceae bacterium]|nr:hypothetical protein [Coxiellaceae bacterium]